MQIINKKFYLISLLFIFPYLHSSAIACQKVNPSPLTFINGIMFGCDCNMEVFIIKGIEKFPNNELHVFDATGIEVYQKEGYQNDWKGNCKDTEINKGDVLYYLFDDGEGKTYSGIIKVN